MENDKKKLERFIGAVNAVTDNQVKELMDEAHRERDAILSAAVSAAEEARQRHLNDNMKMTSGKFVRMVSKAELDKKKEVLLCREELTKELFDKVAAKIRKFTASEDYAKLICDRIAKEDSLRNAKICISPEDMHLEDDIRKAARADIDIAADDSIKYGGYYILRQDKGTITDRTFDCTLKEQQGIFASRNLLTEQEDSNR